MSAGKLGSFGALSVPAADEDVATPERQDAVTSEAEVMKVHKVRGAAKPKRPRGAGETVALTLRLPRKDWARLHEVAVADGVALADLLREGLNRALKARGLAKIDD